MAEFRVAVGGPFNLDFTLQSGQVFRWERRGEWWNGVVPSGLLRIRQEGDSLQCISSSDGIDSMFVRRYFRLDDDLERVMDSIAKDEPTSQAVEMFYGTRLIKQDPWECLASFVLATNSNVPRILGMVRSVCQAFGEPRSFEGETYSAFPEPGRIAGATEDELSSCGLGYRAAFLKHVAAAVDSGSFDLGEVELQDYSRAKELMTDGDGGKKSLLGVGPKVADCVLLFSCGKDEAFPIDVWVGRALARAYPGLLPQKLRKKLLKQAGSKIGAKDYETASRVMRDYFGRNAGYAQQYIYMASRLDSGWPTSPVSSVPRASRSPRPR